MYYIKVHEKIEKIVEIFHLFRVWRKEEFGILRQILWKLLVFSFQVCVSTSLISGGFLSDDKNESVYLIAAGTANLVIAVKLFYILWRKEQVLEFILDIGTHSIADYEEFVKISNKVKKLIKFSFSFNLMTLAASIALIIYGLPIFSSDKRLPFNIWFPLDWKNNAFAYWIANIFISTGLIMTFVSSLLNVIIWYLMLSCANKYQILGCQFRNLCLTKPTIEKRKNPEAEIEKLFVQELIGLIKTHRNIHEKIEQLKSCFENLFFAQITTSAICLCGSVYALAFGSHDGNVIQSMIQVAIMSYNIFDIFMVMYFGNEIKLSSDRLSYCLFESNWIELSQSYKKCIVILTEGLKQPQELVIGKLYPLDLETFTSIINLAYSMFNILKNLN